MTQPDLARLEGLLERANARRAHRQSIRDWNDGRIRARYEIIDELPALLARVRELEKSLSSIHAARLRKDGSDHGYGWSITALNRAVDAALPLIGKQAPPLDPRTAHIAENADRIAQHMSCRFNLNKETPDAG